MGATIGIISGTGNTHYSFDPTGQSQKLREEHARALDLVHLKPHSEGKIIDQKSEGYGIYNHYVLFPLHIKGPDQIIYLSGIAFDLGYSKTQTQLLIVNR